MKKSTKKRRICSSLYHQPLFRIILVLVGIDMIVLGFTFAMGIDIFALVPEMHLILRIIFGLLYVLVALFIIHYALAYKDVKEMCQFVCHDCAHQFKKKD